MDELVLSLVAVFIFAIGFGFMVMIGYANSHDEPKCPNCGKQMKSDGHNNAICPNCGKKIEHTHCIYD